MSRWGFDGPEYFLEPSVLLVSGVVTRAAVIQCHGIVADDSKYTPSNDCKQPLVQYGRSIGESVVPNEPSLASSYS